MPHRPNHSPLSIHIPASIRMNYQTHVLCYLHMMSELSKHWFLQVVSVTLQAFPRGVRTSNDSLKKDIGTKHQLPSAQKLVSLSPALASSHPHIVNAPATLHGWEDWLQFYKRPLCPNRAGIPWRGGRNGTSVPLCDPQSFSSVGSWGRWYWMISDSFFFLHDVHPSYTYTVLWGNAHSLCSGSPTHLTINSYILLCPRSLTSYSMMGFRLLFWWSLHMLTIGCLLLSGCYY